MQRASGCSGLFLELLYSSPMKSTFSGSAFHGRRQEGSCSKEGGAVQELSLKNKAQGSRPPPPTGQCELRQTPAIPPGSSGEKAPQVGSLSPWRLGTEPLVSLGLSHWCLGLSAGPGPSRRLGWDWLLAEAPV